MELIEKIRNEIERRITDNTFGAKLELIDILAWLDTLENTTEANEVLMGRVKAPSLDMESIRRRLDTLQEPDVDLEDEIEKRYDQAKWGYVDGFGSVCMDKGQFTRIARHFYELGLQNAK